MILWISIFLVWAGISLSAPGAEIPQTLSLATATQGNADVASLAYRHRRGLLTATELAGHCRRGDRDLLLFVALTLRDYEPTPEAIEAMRDRLFSIQTQDRASRKAMVETLAQWAAKSAEHRESLCELLESLSYEGLGLEEQIEGELTKLSLAFPAAQPYAEKAAQQLAKLRPPTCGPRLALESLDPTAL